MSTPDTPTNPNDIDSSKLEALLAAKANEQRLVLAAAAGAATAVVCAAAWAAITVATEYQIGWMAVGVGFAVGFAVRAAGKGMTTPFRVVGAACALLGCLAGNLLSAVAFLGQAQSTGFGTALAQLDVETAVKLMEVTFSPMDLLFYGIGIYGGWKASLITLTEAEIASCRVTAARPASPAPAPEPTTNAG